MLGRYEVPSGLSGEDAFEHWRAWYGSAVESPMRLERVTTSPRERFHPSAATLSGRCFSLIEVRNEPAAGYWPGSADCGDLRLVCFRNAPSVRLEVSGREMSIASGHVMFLDASRPGGFRAPAGLHAVQVNVRRSTLGVSPADARRLLDVEGLARHPLVAALIVPALMRWNQPGIDGEVEAVGSVLVSAMASLVGSVLEAKTGTEALRPARRRAVVQFVEANYRDPGLSLDGVASHFGMSRRSLFHLFEGHRVHLGEHLRALRTVRALELLAGPSASGMSATDIACSAGFSNAQSLRRALKQASGLTVREARHEVLLARSCLVRLRESARLAL